MRKNNYGREYFEGIYAHLKKEKELVLRSFFDLLVLEKRGIKQILDLGCGEGDFLKICQNAGFECCGVDISSFALKKAKERVKGGFRNLDLEKERLPWPDGFFDAVVAFDLLEHLGAPDLVLSEAWRVLREEGVLFLTTPNGGYWLGRSLGRFIPGDPTHVNIQNKSYWRQRLKRAGFSKVWVKGCLLFGFPPNLDLRCLLKRFKLPVLTKPIFFPIMGLASELFIFARK